MSNIVFDDEMGRIQRAVAESHDLVVRRNIFMDSLNLRTGEKVLELGCGGGSYAFEAAQFIGSTGHISAIDISADQIAAARERCAGFAWVECQIGNLLELPHQDGEFDAVYSVQVLEYAGDLGKAFREIHRVLRDGGPLCQSLNQLVVLRLVLGKQGKDAARSRRLVGSRDPSGSANHSSRGTP
jgi:arsenite methyltransferase